MFSIFKKRTHTQGFWPQVTRRDLFVLAAGIAAFVGIASSTITKFSIWFDEAFSSYLLRFNLVDITVFNADDVHPPFYYWLLKGWTALFGDGELGMRSMTLFFGALTLAITFGLMMRLFGRKTAYLSLLFMVLSPMLIRFSQEARMYTVVTTIAFAATYILVYAQQNAKKRWPWVAYGTLLALGVLTHYFIALVWLAHWVWRWLVVRGDGTKKAGQTAKAFFTKPWVWTHVLAIGLYLAWLPWMLRQLIIVQGNGFWIPAITPSTLGNFFTNFFTYTDQSVPASTAAGVTPWLTVGVTVALLGLLWLVIRLLQTLKGEARTNYLLIVCMALVPIALLIVVSLPPARPMFIDRYLMTSVVAMSLLIAATLVLSRGVWAQRWRVGLGTLVGVLFIVGIGVQANIGNFNKNTKQSNQAREIVEAAREVKGDAPILAANPWAFYEAVPYETDESPIYFADETTGYEFGSLRMLKEDDSRKIKDVDAFANEAGEFWVFGSVLGNASGELPLMRDTWTVKDRITLNDRVLTDKPLIQAVLVSAE